MKIIFFDKIINSAKLAWKGEESFWKVFWLWGFLLYFVAFILFVSTAFPTNDFVYTMAKKTYMQPLVIILFFYVLPFFITTIIKRNIKNIKIKTNILRRISLAFILIFVTPFLSVHLFFTLSFLMWASKNTVVFFVSLVSICVLTMNFLFYRKIRSQIKLIS